MQSSHNSCSTQVSILKMGCHSPTSSGFSATNLLELGLSAFTVIGTAAYIWLLEKKVPWTAVVLVGIVLLLWYRQGQTWRSLGLSISELVRSLTKWRMLWIIVATSFVVTGRHILLNPHILLRGVFYFVWCAAQQIVYQSVLYLVLRRTLTPVYAAAISGLIFGILHAPNPILICGTLIWGAISSLLFEGCRTIFGVALLQVMLSSLLMWLTPYHLHRGFRVGPSYYSAPPARTGDMVQGGSQ